ncbi:septum site-determining protein MinC [Elysia marginata]|uniref:Septum site-determining protein MinC n=1 Tax=Elysia marginata TaxID=1093978 RepID=A0AAV4IDJ1_9GAST|nr:septum site-determining protein MinC [Elysia marginata]
MLPRMITGTTMTSTITPHTVSPCFQLKGSMVTLMTLELFHFSEIEFRAQLQTLVAQAPRFFENTPVVLALERLSNNSNTPDFDHIRSLCAGFGINIFAIRGGNHTLQQAAANAGLACLPAQKSNTVKRKLNPTTTPAKEAPSASILPMTQGELPLDQQPEESTQEANQKTVGNDSPKPTKSSPTTRIITHPVRSGQQIYHPGELIILAPVGAGAEILADGNIHVYGPLRGRALAGVNGNNKAHIFCQHFEAELISINGRFKPAGTIDEKFWKSAVHAWLDEDNLRFEAL